MSSDAEIKAFLEQHKTIAVVGLSPKPDRASHRVSAYMQQVGYKIIPVHPAASNILGETCYPSLKDIPEDIEIGLVNVFRRGEQTPPIAEAAVEINAKGFWLQKGIINEDSMRIVKSAGLLAVQDLCLMVEHRRLF
ncbi:CoA-binding protein [Magnetococcales bacterium HHB-1]